MSATGSPSTTLSPITKNTTRPTEKTNRDGANDNRSWNCGAEPTDDPAVEKLRNRQTKLLDNNAYCQDNETSWFVGR